MVELRLGQPVSGRNDQADTCLGVHRYTAFLSVVSKGASAPPTLTLASLFLKFGFPCQGSFERAEIRFGKVEKYHQCPFSLPAPCTSRSLFRASWRGCVFHYTGCEKKDTGAPIFLGFGKIIASYFVGLTLTQRRLPLAWHLALCHRD
jgi:hypothetical protein